MCENERVARCGGTKPTRNLCHSECVPEERGDGARDHPWASQDFLVHQNIIFDVYYLNSFEWHFSSVSRLLYYVIGPKSEGPNTHNFGSYGDLYSDKWEKDIWEEFFEHFFFEKEKARCVRFLAFDCENWWRNPTTSHPQSRRRFLGTQCWRDRQTQSEFPSLESEFPSLESGPHPIPMSTSVT